MPALCKDPACPDFPDVHYHYTSQEHTAEKRKVKALEYIASNLESLNASIEVVIEQLRNFR